MDSEKVEVEEKHPDDWFASLHDYRNTVNHHVAAHVNKWDEATKINLEEYELALLEASEKRLA